MAEGEKERAMESGRERRRRRVRTTRRHPLAGRSGEGAPIAPPGWLWKAGNRAWDTYFYSPSGQPFRSQQHLRAYLHTLPDPPPLSQFKWRIAPDDFKHVPLPGVPLSDDEDFEDKKVKSEIAEMPRKYKRMKLSLKKQTQQQQDIIKFPNEVLKLENNSKRCTGRSQGPPVSVRLLEDGQQVGHRSNNTIKKEVDQRSRKEKIIVSFEHLLSTPTSYTILLKDAEVLQKFLDEAESLKDKSESDLYVLRNLLISRKRNPIQLFNYPETVLRVFYFLLRNEDAPAGFGKRELVELCSEWSCKYKHYWCFLERRRIEFLSNSVSSAEDPWNKQLLLEGKASGNLKEQIGKLLDDVDVPQHISSVSKDLLSIDIPESILGEAVQGREGHEANCISVSSLLNTQANGSSVQKRDGFKEPVEVANSLVQNSNGSTIPEALPLIQKNNSGVTCGNDISYKFQSAVDDENLDKSMERYLFFGEPRAECLITVNHKAEEPISSPKGTVCKEKKELLASSNIAKERLQNKSQQKHPSQSGDGKKKLIEKCSCQICKELSFCYGCTCSICRSFIESKQIWSFVTCPYCFHLCHLECVSMARRAGVVKELELDGELLCPSCNRKSDLVSFWRDRVKDALRSIDRLELQKHLKSAVLVLNGTTREPYNFIHRHVIELHNSLLDSTPFPNLHDLLHQIHEKMDGLTTTHSPLGIMHSAMDASDGELWLEADKVSQCQKKAEADFEKWLMAEKNADIQQMLLRSVTEQVSQAEDDVKSKAYHAKASRLLLEQTEQKLQVMRRNSQAKSLYNAQLELQRGALNLELSEFNKLQDKLTTYSQENSSETFSLLLEHVKMQQARVEAAKSRLEQTITLGSFFQ